jgi:hypothetical protein
MKMLFILGEKMPWCVWLDVHQTGRTCLYGSSGTSDDLFLGGCMMQATVPVLLTFIAAALNGLVAGASLDQSIKQLPARHRMGVIAFSAYSRAADLSGRGIAWYAFLGVSSALLTITAAVTTFVAGSAQTVPILIAAILSVLHSITTTQAAPTNFRQRKVINDEVALTALFNKFERWQTARAILQVLTFIATLWAIFVLG